MQESIERRSEGECRLQTYISDPEKEDPRLVALRTTGEAETIETRKRAKKVNLSCIDAIFQRQFCAMLKDHRI